MLFIIDPMHSFEDRIKATGMRLTYPRKKIAAILEAARCPLSAEEILASDETGSLDLVTTYRNLAVFCKHGFAHVIQLENGKQLFEIQHGDHDHHHHIVCRKCHHVVRLDLCFGSELEKYARDRGFTAVSHTFEVFGICADCSAGSDGPSAG